MPPQGIASSYVDMPITEKMAKTMTSSPPQGFASSYVDMSVTEKMAKTMTITPPQGVGDSSEIAHSKRSSSWKTTARKSTSKITPSSTSPLPPRVSSVAANQGDAAIAVAASPGKPDVKLSIVEPAATAAPVVVRRPGRVIPVAFAEAFARDEAAVADSPHMGPYLLKLAKSYATGENPVKALEYCIRAVKFYEKHVDNNVLDLVISLHILASLHCHLGQYEDAVALLERALSLPDLECGNEDHFLAAFNGHMQMGDTHSMGGKLGQSLEAYHRALDIQKSFLGEFDHRVAETCTYIAEAHLQVRHMTPTSCIPILVTPWNLKSLHIF